MNRHCYDPRPLGSRCDLCVLGPEHNDRGWNPVPPEHEPEAVAAAIGEAPGAEEEREGGPFRGKSGGLWDQMLGLLGVQREQVALFNLLACRPENNKFDLLATKTKRANEGRRARGLPELIHPAEACLPRLLKEIQSFEHLITLGGAPTQYLTGEQRGILAVRGVARDWFKRKVMPTVHPAFVLRKPHYTPVLAADLRRGFRTFYGTLDWKLPDRTDILSVPGQSRQGPRPAEVLRRWFERARAEGAVHIAYDVETDGLLSPTRVGLRTLAMAYTHAPRAGRTYCPECWGARVSLAHHPSDTPEQRKVLQPYTFGMHVFATRVRLGLDPFAGEAEELLGVYQLCRRCQGTGRVEHITDVTTCTIAFKAPDPAGMLEDEQEIDPETGKKRKRRRRPDIKYLSDTDAREVFDLLAYVFVEEPFVWVGHNAGYYDRMVLEQPRYVGCAPRQLIDTILLARANNAELDKTLGVWGSIFTDVPSAWKADNEGKKKATSSRSVIDLTDYNETDSVVTMKMATPMWVGASERGYTDPLRPELRALFWDDENAPRNLFEVDLHTQALACDMHRVGQYVDLEARADEEVALTRQIAELTEKLSALAYKAGFGQEGTKSGAKHTRGKKVIKHDPFNPGSNPHVAELLYDIWELEIKKYTETEQISVDDEVLLDHLLDDTTEPHIKAWIFDLRHYRTLVKILGTYVRPYAPDGSDDGLIWPDGRVHASWNCHTPNVGRFSCSGPNLQNILKRVKPLYVAQPGHILVGCDLDQAHLRIIANEWKIPLFLDAFLEGVDPHGRYASWVYKGGDGEPGYTAHPDWAMVGGYDPSKKPPAESKALGNMRNAAKAGIYIFLYEATAETACKNLRATPGKDGVSLPFLNMMTPALVSSMRDELLANQPFEAVWSRIKRQHHRDRYLSSYLFGRRSDVATFKGNEEVNFPVLATESDIMRIVEYRVRKLFWLHRWGPGTGIINQCHDSITVEVPIELAEWARETLLRCFTVHIPGWVVPVTASADIGWFTDPTGRVSPAERESIDPSLILPRKSEKDPWRYKTDFGGRLRSRWSDT